MNIYVSNLKNSISNQDLNNLFSTYGEVKSAAVVMDVFTGTSRGFGYVEMNDDEEAQNAISSLHNSLFNEQTISVQEAETKKIHKGSYKVGDGPVSVYKFGKN
jgi:RNA recognition motif-containing protein